MGKRSAAQVKAQEHYEELEEAGLHTAILSDGGAELQPLRPDDVEVQIAEIKEKRKQDRALAETAAKKQRLPAPALAPKTTTPAVRPVKLPLHFQATLVKQAKAADKKKEAGNKRGGKNDGKRSKTKAKGKRTKPAAP